MEEMNATFAIHKETRHVETTATKLNLKKTTEMETLFVVLSLNERRGSSEKIWPDGGCFISPVLTVTGESRPTLIKYSSVLGDKNIKSVTRIWGQNSGN